MKDRLSPPHPQLGRYYGTEAERRAYLATAFDETARFYDRINAWMSFGTDRWYRRQALKRSALGRGFRVLDVGCGTGLISEICRTIVGPRGQVVSIDPSAGMLREALSNSRIAFPIQGCAEALPLTDQAFDLVVMGFALRHVTDLHATFLEYRRILKPGGRVLLLEMTLPRPGLTRELLKAHMRYLTPFLARFVTGSRAAPTLYEYCWDTFDRCVPPAVILESLEKAGFQDPRRFVSGGIFSEYSAQRPE